MTRRSANYERRTLETSAAVSVVLAGGGAIDIRSGIAFLDHLLGAMAHHAQIDVTLQCAGDLHVDDHHTVEDCALALGAAIDRALAERRGIARFGYAYAPLDESLARAVIDLSGRPFAAVDLKLRREAIGALACENIGHFFRSMATSLRAAVHVDVLRGDNDHHKAEAAFKAMGLALRQAVAPAGSPAAIPSTKGVL